jgi:PBP1b-binding outer membrane lipoprotein LpoB
MKKLVTISLLLFVLIGCKAEVSLKANAQPKPAVKVKPKRIQIIESRYVDGVEIFVLRDIQTGHDYMLVESPYGNSVVRLSDSK